MENVEYNINEWAWGKYDVSDKGQILVENGKGNSGYRCPICGVNQSTKRKDVFKKHLKKHNTKVEIPNMKEKCAKCGKPGDPNPQKKEASTIPTFTN